MFSGHTVFNVHLVIKYQKIKNRVTLIQSFSHWSTENKINYWSKENRVPIGQTKTAFIIQVLKLIKKQKTLLIYNQLDTLIVSIELQRKCLYL